MPSLYEARVQVTFFATVDVVHDFEIDDEETCEDLVAGMAEDIAKRCTLHCPQEVSIDDTEVTAMEAFYIEEVEA